jgi:HSP20 family protein
MLPTKFRRRTETPDIFGGLSQLRRELDEIFETGSDWMSPLRSSGLLEGAWSPLVDVFEDKNNVRVRAEMPGLKKEEIEVSVQGQMLILKGERRRELDENKNNVHRIERTYGRFHRTVSLPCQVNSDQVKATYKDGILDIALPKKEESKPKQIQVDGK